MSSIKDFYNLITKDGIEAKLLPVTGTLSPKIFHACRYNLSATTCPKTYPLGLSIAPLEKRQYSFRRFYMNRVFEYEED